ncbi:MAG: ParB/RepB/Spo0J family partition protein [Defluviitaleaceae bacterium]|nr:ParB/RepB/Spo0J family partition protein [Defluviitaleaceae bacterium]
MKRGLGKGLGALIEENITEESDNNLKDIDITLIEPNPNQPRKIFKKENLEELAISIKEYGIIQPIVVNEVKTSERTFYTIIAGERRYRASRIAELSKIPCIVKTFSQMEALQVALIENIQRQDLNPIEEAICYKKLQEYFFHKNQEIAEKVGKSRNTISSRISLLNLCKEVQELIYDSKISASHGILLLGFSEEQQIKIANEIIDKNMSVRELLTLIKEKDKKNKETNVYKNIYRPYVKIESSLKESLGTKVNIKDKNGKGKIEIEYYSKEDLERIINIIS